MRITPAELFAPRWTCFWATAYQFEPALFEQFLFRRLGDPPLNATLLLDAGKLAETWAALAGGDQWRLQRAGRDYLVRGVRQGTGSFHAKTYFFGNSRDGILLVGSGNLDLRGLEQGHEVFSRFASTDEPGLATIRGWRDWMQGIVDELDDDDVRRRWWDLRSKARWLGGPGTQSPFVTTADSSILAQLQDDLPESVDELHVLAPFMDRGAAALGELVKATKPRHLHHYICHNLSVDGPALERLLRGLDCDVSLWRFDPDRFVHAKLVGLTWGDQGRVLSGSANLSRAAITSARASDVWANVEAGVVVDASADAVRSLFQPPDLSVEPLTLDAVTSLSYHEPAEETGPDYFIRFARRAEDQRVEVAVDPQPPANALVYLTDGATRSRVIEGRTADPLQLSDGAVLVWLEDDARARVSNIAALDDPASLTAWLQEPTRGTDKPRELESDDLETPIGAMLQRLHRACIFDIDETAAVSNAQRALDAEGGEEADPAFWDRLVQEELDLDRRIAAYRRFSSRLPFDDDEVLLLLREMLGRTPVHHVSGGGSDGEPPVEEKTPGKPWTPEQRLQVRLFHVLDRWSRATNDPRLRWVNPAAPVRNFTALLPALMESWEHRYLAEPKLLALLQTLFESFITGEATPGYLLALDDADRIAALDRLPADARTLASALVYVGLRPKSNWQKLVFDWQPFLIAGIELGVFQAGPGCEEAIERMCGDRATAKAVDDHLLALADYVDDAHWCSRLQKELSLESVLFQSASFAPPFKLALAVRGITDPLADPRLVTLVRRAFHYKRVPGMVVMGPDWRMSIADGEPANVRLPTGAVRESSRKLTAAYLATLDQQRLGLGDIFAAGQEAAS